MKKIIAYALYPALGLAVFVVVLAVLLASKGSLNRDSLKNVPLVGGGQKKEPESVPTVETMRYFSSEELTAMLREARELKQKADKESERVAKRQKRLEILRGDLQREKQELLSMRSDLEGRAAEVRAAAKALDERLLLVDRIEAAGLQRSASIHEAMDPKKTAAAISELDRDQAAKLLSFIEEKKAARILQEMEPKDSAELLSTVRRVGTEQAEGGND
jgi:flagellar motility protein MotE (MotC chaperone)